LKPTISISFLDHLLFPNVPDYHLSFRLLEESHHFPFIEDLDFHILELPKFAKSVEELVTDLDVWLYFFRHAETMDTDALPTAFNEHPLVRRAFTELMMLTQTELERERYESRRKAQLDYQTGLKVARLEGLIEGREEGLIEGRAKERADAMISMIHFCETMLARSPTPTKELASLSLEDLTRLADELQAQVLKRR
jgi:predicted transposase/invertase (TIGR01784 family)